MTGPAVTFADIERARDRLAGVAHRTPVFRSRQFDEESGATVFFKAENLQRAGAFKFRGAFNKLKAEMERGPVREVVAFSSGNHAQAVALVSRLLGVPATVVMPSDAPAAKVEATRGYGAQVVFYDRQSESRDNLAEEICRERGALMVPPFDDPLIMAGAGTATAEFLEDVPDLDVLVIPVSGGGLIAGNATAAKHLRPEIEVFGVEPETGDDTARSMESGERVTIPVPPTIADGLRVTAPGRLTFPIIQKLVRRVLLVSDAEMVETLSWMLQRMKLLVEPSGVAGAAAVRHRKADLAGRRVGVILSGGNMDLAALAGYVQETKAMAAGAR